MFWGYMCICTLKHSVRCQGFPSDYRGFVYQLYNWKQDFKDDVGHPTSPSTKKDPVAGHRGLFRERGEHPFLLLGCMCLFEYGRNKQRYLINSKWESRMEGASVRWQGTVRKDTVVFRIFLREWEKPEPYFCQPSMRIIL